MAGIPPIPEVQVLFARQQGLTLTKSHPVCRWPEQKLGL